MRLPRRLFKSSLIFAGGLSLGLGLLLVAQSQLLYALKDEAREAGWFWRGLGQATFVWQDSETQSALWAHDFPMEIVRHIETGGSLWIGLGFLLLLGSHFVTGPKC